MGAHGRGGRSRGSRRARRRIQGSGCLALALLVIAGCAAVPALIDAALAAQTGEVSDG